MIFSSRNVLGKGALRNLEMEYLRSCCFTGHREIPLEKYGEIWSAVEREALKLYGNGVRTFIVGGALGFDMLCGEDIYFDTAYILRFIGEERFKKILAKHGEDNILFASDSPWSDIKGDVEILKSFSLNKQTEKKLFCDNAKKLLGI